VEPVLMLMAALVGSIDEYGAEHIAQKLEHVGVALFTHDVCG
jgi:hypothetical protein